MVGAVAATAVRISTRLATKKTNPAPRSNRFKGYAVIEVTVPLAICIAKSIGFGQAVRLCEESRRLARRQESGDRKQERGDRRRRADCAGRRWRSYGVPEDWVVRVTRISAPPAVEPFSAIAADRDEFCQVIEI